MDDHAAPPEDGIAPPLLPLWKNPDYILLWCGQLISSIGTSTSQLAYSLLVLLLTNSPAQAGLVSAFSLVPYFVFGLPIGALVDRWNRKMTMIVCDVGRGLCMGSITLALVLGWLTVVQLYIVALGDGVFFVFFNVAQVASLPRIMPEEQLPVAGAQNDGIDKIAPVIGSFLGGSLFAVLRMLPFLLDMLSYMVSAVTLFFHQSLVSRRAPPQYMETVPTDCRRTHLVLEAAVIALHGFLRLCRYCHGKRCHAASRDSYCAASRSLSSRHWPDSGLWWSWRKPGRSLDEFFLGAFQLQPDNYRMWLGLATAVARLLAIAQCPHTRRNCVGSLFHCSLV